MLRMADVVHMHGAGYLARFGSGVLPSHVRALRAITACRTPSLGGHVARCASCNKEHLLFHSCQHRACPQCGQRATARWLDRQRGLLLPVPYYHVVFTLPAELRDVVRSNQRVLVSALFRAAFESLSALCSDPRWLGGQVGALAVLHTWTRTLGYHPHVHMLVPAGGLAPDGHTWVTPPRRATRFLVPVRALASHFRGRFLHLARRALPQLQLPKIPWDKPWVVFAKPAGKDGEQVLRYLGRYVHRTALSDKAITSCSDTGVSFRYRDSRSGLGKSMTLPPHEFLRRFLQHVPPRGMHRVRAFGLLHPAHRNTLRRLQLLLAPPDKTAPDSAQHAERAALPRCPYCRQPSPALGRRLSAGQCRAYLARVPMARAPPAAEAAATSIAS